MVAVFATFATLPLVSFKQLGIGLAAAIAIDATIVRGVALPAALTLLGDRGLRRAGRRQRHARAWDHRPMRSFSKPAMSDRAKPLIGRAALAPPAGLAALLLVIWALTGAGYFWPMWAWFGLAVPLSLIAAVRWVRALPDARNRGLGTQAVACFGVLVVGNLAIWLMSGGGYFWPVWPLMTLAVLLGLWRIAPRPREPSSRSGSRN